MKAKQLLDAIGQLDERYIEEAEAEIHGRRFGKGHYHMPRNGR